MKSPNFLIHDRFKESLFGPPFNQTGKRQLWSRMSLIIFAEQKMSYMVISSFGLYTFKSLQNIDFKDPCITKHSHKNSFLYCWLTLTMTEQSFYYTEQ